MRALIIGCGYVGLPLAAELARQGHEVFGLRRNPSSKGELEAAGIKPLFADITRPEELKKLPRNFDWVVNCVASGGGGVEDYRRVYLEGTRNLVEWLAPASTGASRFVYTSSTSVYGQNDGSMVNETSSAKPDAETARILVETEEVLLEAYQQKNFPAIILRVAGIYGPGRGHWFKQFLKGEARLDGQGERILNMIHHDDVVGCLIAALKSGRPREIYNAVDDEPVSQFDFFSWLATRLNRPLPASQLENLEAARKRGVTSKRVLNQKMKTELGYRFKYPTFREGYTAEIQRLARENPNQKA